MQRGCLHVTYKPTVQQRQCFVQFLEAIKTTGTYDFHIFDYSNATYTTPSQIHVIRYDPVSVIDSVFTLASRCPLSANI